MAEGSTQDATLQGVSVETNGSELSNAAAVSDTTLTVTWAVDFSESGGILRLAGEEYFYDTVDKETDTVHLLSPVTVAAGAGETVEVLAAPGREAQVWTALAATADDDSEPVPAVIPQDQIAYFAEGATPVGAAIRIAAETDGSYRVVSILGGETPMAGNLSMGSTPDSTGSEIIRMGDMPQGDRGLAFYREDGTLAFEMRKAFDPTNPQAWTLYDRDGNGVVAENTLGPGLLRPHLEHPFQPVAATLGAVQRGPYGLAETTSSGSWTTVFAYDGKLQNLFLDMKFATICSDGTTAGEIQVVDLLTATPLPGFFTSAWVGAIPTGTTTWTVIDPTPVQVVLPFAAGHASQMRLGVQVRRTAGAGTITLSVVQAIGG